MPPRQANLNVQEGDEEQRGFLSGDLENNHEPTRDAVKRDRPTDHRYSTLLPLAIFFLSIVFLVSGVWYKQPDRRCVQKMNAWSPMMEAVQYHPLLHSKESNAPFIGKPTTKLEQEWDKLWQFGSLGIPDEKLPLLNKSTTEYPWHHVPSELGGGVEAFFEGFHYLHCLNLVRQYLHRHDYDYSHIHAFSNTKIPILDHVEHCLEMLRATITCESDTTPYYVLHDAKKGAILDVTTPKRCRVFSSMAEWANDHITIPFHEHKHM